ncbi:MAG: hypothetical protein GX996_05650, partial [Firmicutes bacterium]|nr:hypothetical protein [Bacillota bacterium]
MKGEGLDLLEVDETARAEAAALIADDGPLGAEAISNRIVDRVSDIMSFGAGDIQLVDRGFADDIRSEHLKGMGKSKERIVLLLDPQKILSLSEL